MQVNIGEAQTKTKRDSKGKSLLEALSDYVALDLETTGLDPHYDSIIEVATVRVESGVIIDRFHSLVNPGFNIDEFITELTGITNDMLLGAPSLKDILPVFIDFLGDSVIVAHNANFDINFIYDGCAELLQAGFTNNFVDTMRVSRRLFPEHTTHTLAALVDRFNICGTVDHRALSDALKAYECYEYMKKHAKENGIDFPSLYPKKLNKKQYSAKDIQTGATEFDESTPMYGKLFVFTGALDRMPRREAMQLVVDMGGLCADSVTKKTNFLVLGNHNYCSTIKDGKSGKQKKAEQLLLSGIDIETISEDVFYDMLAEAD